MRQIVLDTETTGLEASAGHRIIEIGCIELVNRRVTKRSFHRYFNPRRAVDAGALEVHGIDDDFLATQPFFEDSAAELIDFVRDAELVIHNAEFDVGFINHELARLEGEPTDITEICGVLDTLSLARRMHPGQRNDLNALAKRYGVDNSAPELHGALLDARILAEVYIAMTGGQVSLLPDREGASTEAGKLGAERIDRDGLELVVQRATDAELEAHEALLAKIREECGGPALWDDFEGHSEEGADKRP